MDYRALLVKYMQHVRDVESVTYTESRPDGHSFGGTTAFTDEEWDALLKIAAEMTS